MSYFEANLALLSVHQPELALQLRGIPEQCVKVFPSASGLPSSRYERGETTIALHSRYDPLKEARQTIKRSNCSEADYFIFLGFGLGYLLDAVIEEHGHPSNHYFIVESDLEIFKAAFEARDLASILTLPHVHFAWPVSGIELAAQWRDFFDPVQAQQSTFITHLPSITLDSSLFKAAAEIIKSQTFQVFTDINTLVAKSQTFLDNFTQNLLKSAQAPGVVKFAKMFPGIPAIIVSAGPSLDKNIHELLGYEDQALILSTDTALKPLLANGIEPHFVLTGDPSHLNYLHIKGASSNKAYLVAESTSYPEVFKEFEGRTIACTYENSSLRSLADLLGNKGTLRAWGSVATMALDFALLLGCNPIIFIGQDLAHTDGRIYCADVFFNKEWFAETSDPAGWQSQLANLRSSRKTLTIEDIFGRPIESTDKLTAYWNWIIKVIHDHPEVRFINATEGGILREQVEIQSLRETLYRCCEKDLNLRASIQKAYVEAQENKLLSVDNNLAALMKEQAAMQDVLDRGLRLCEINSGYSAQDLIKRLEVIKESIYDQPHLAPLIDCFNQMGNITFLRKRNRILKHNQPVPSLIDIRNTYLEYLTSVQESLNLISNGLYQIEAQLKL